MLPTRGDDLEAFAATLRSGLGNLDFQGRQRLVRLLVERVVVTGDHVAIEHAIPLTGRFCGFASTLSTSRIMLTARAACVCASWRPRPTPSLAPWLRRVLARNRRRWLRDRRVRTLRSCGCRLSDSTLTLSRPTRSPCSTGCAAGSGSAGSARG
jgi:hypothetical protein